MRDFDYIATQIEEFPELVPAVLPFVTVQLKRYHRTPSS